MQIAAYYCFILLRQDFVFGKQWLPKKAYIRMKKKTFPDDTVLFINTYVEEMHQGCQMICFRTKNSIVWYSF
jgi:hypothetical protein